MIGGGRLGTPYTRTMLRSVAEARLGTRFKKAKYNILEMRFLYSSLTGMSPIDGTPPLNISVIAAIHLAGGRSKEILQVGGLTAFLPNWLCFTMSTNGGLSSKTCASRH